jgi:phytanoyl-CoA hydroxylase
MLTLGKKIRGILRNLAAPPEPQARPRPLTADQERFFFDNGYLVLPGFVTDEEVEAVNDAVDLAWSDKSIYNNLTITAYTGTPRNVDTYMRFLDRDARDGLYKLNHLYLYDHRVMSLLLSDKLQDAMGQLLGGAPFMFNGLNLERGSEQRFHFDTFYMPPRTPGKMVATWVALEDIHPDSGPLNYYPRSHLIPPFPFNRPVHDQMGEFDQFIDREIAARGLVPEGFCPRKGDVFIWHAQLYHGGGRINDRRRTRKSMVNHFWRMEDYPPEWAYEPVPGRFVMKRDRMFVLPTFKQAA